MRDLPVIPASLSLSEIISAEHRAVELARSTDYSMRAVVIPADPTADPRPVVNLGWLMRHRADVRHPLQGLGFTVRGWRYLPSDGSHYARVERFDPVLIAHLSDGRTYACQFADPSVLFDFLDRPSFRGYLCRWEASPTFEDYSTTAAIGSADWAKIRARLAAGYARRAVERHISEHSEYLTVDARHRARPTVAVPAEISDRLSELREDLARKSRALDIGELRKSYRRAVKLADGEAVDACADILSALSDYLGEGR